MATRWPTSRSCSSANAWRSSCRTARSAGATPAGSAKCVGGRRPRGPRPPPDALRSATTEETRTRMSLEPDATTPTAPLPELREADLDPDPFVQFRRWYRAAEEAQQPLPEAMALATATPDGAPSLRMVLLKGVDARG